MLEVVFEQSTAGGLKIAKSSRPGQKSVRTMSAVYTGDMTPEAPLPPLRQEVHVWAGADLGGSVEDIALISMILDVGDLSALETPGRRAEIERLYGPLAEAWKKGREEALERYWRQSMDTLVRLRNAGEEPVRLWAAPWCPGDMCGVYFVCDLLRDSEAPVSVVWASKEMMRKDGVMVELRGLGEVDPEALGALAAGAVPLELVQRRTYANRWRQLARENAPLRAMINGQLVSVPADFYDFALLTHLPVEEPRTMGQVLGDTLRQLPGVGDGWLYLRLMEQVKEGTVRIVEPPQPDHPYSGTILRVTT